METAAFPTMRGGHARARKSGLPLWIAGNGGCRMAYSISPLTRTCRGVSMKRLIICFALLVLALDLADCALLGRAEFFRNQSLHPAAFLLPPAFFQHLKVLAEKDDFPVIKQPLLAHDHDFFVLQDWFLVHVFAFDASSLLKITPFSQFPVPVASPGNFLASLPFRRYFSKISLFIRTPWTQIWFLPLSWDIQGKSEWEVILDTLPPWLRLS